jgi:UDP-GlcNAc:undecaprenyl-phosphate GlcNAc-1-phosphate transferase
MAPRLKLAIQVLAALCVIIPGYTFRRILYFDNFLLPVWIQYALTFFWIVGLTNAVNLIDGVDGLAGGFAVLASLSFALISAPSPFVLPICFCLAASVCGFLVFNFPFPKAKIFMGDGGSQFLGFTLALLPLVKNSEASPDIPLLYPAALLIIPILDTVAAVWRRLRDKKRIDHPDRFHIHHKLLRIGLPVLGVDLVLWGLQAMTGILVYVSIRFRGPLSFLFLGLAYAAAGFFFVCVHFLNRLKPGRIKAQKKEPEIARKTGDSSRIPV